MPGRLFLVATPIGNLNDLSARAIEVLKEVGLIACEDTRHSRILLDHYGIATATTSLPAFAEADRAAALADRVVQGLDLAVITDAGSPGISDPGERLVAEAVARGLTVVPIPGASAAIAAVSASGLPTSRFHFLGFLPRQTSDARAMLEEVSSLSASLVLYESPRRLAATLALASELLGGSRNACVARELTKIHEEFVRGTLDALAARYAGQEVLGEVVLIIEGRTGPARWGRDEVEKALHAGLASGERLKPLSKELATRSGWSSHELYRLGLAIKGE